MAQHFAGVWIWQLSSLPADYLEKLKAINCQRVYLKVFDGKSSSMFWSDQCSTNIISKFHQAGIEVYGWGYHYGTPDVQAQVTAVREAINCQLDGYILDVEEEVKNVNTHENVKKLLQALRPYVKPGTLGYTSFGNPQYHPEIPWKLLDDLCDIAMPQMYFEKWTSKPQEYETVVQEAFTAHEQFNLNKPILPIWGSESDTQNPTTADILQKFLKRYPGSSIWRLPNAGEAGEAFKLEYSGEELPIPPESFIYEQAAKAVFKMQLKYSSGLLLGNIFLFDADGNQIFDAVATTGRPGYQSPNHLWKRALGPIPDRSGLAISTEDVMLETDDSNGWSFPILPHVLASEDGHIKRGGFQLYNDAGTPGTAGGIGIINSESFTRFRALLLALKQQGIDSIPLEIEYKKPPQTLPASLVFSFRRDKINWLITGCLSVLDQSGTAIFEAEATSGAAGYQSADDHWQRSAGPLPSEEMIVNGPITVSTVAHYSELIGIEGYFFDILPLVFHRNDGYTRSHFGIHFDANVPGSAGCIVLTKRHEFDAFTDLMVKANQSGIDQIPLKVQYSDAGTRGFADEWWQKLLESRRVFA
ncbi:hypothetical protein NG799_08480 [Laspinema sp. D1]|uniref:Uncharacterized protein n=1 Tax=Laspinema palackyanum D2a TaxID=2953684 RepID=A0ABT2MS41_9CYAN|nr:hypothetical protein [Laspinema sp. D2a]